MSTLNRFELIGRLTNGGELKKFDNGGAVFQFGFAVTGQRKKVGDEWQEEPCFFDVKAFDRKEGRQMATQLRSSVKKGSRLYIEGHMIQEKWTTQEGNERKAYRLIVDHFIWLDPKTDGGANDPEEPPTEGATEAMGGGGGDDGDIPF